MWTSRVSVWLRRPAKPHSEVGQYETSLYQRERNHQGLGNELIDGGGGQVPGRRVRRRQRIGGLLSYYRAA
jgi:hypothetical protein